LLPRSAFDRLPPLVPDAPSADAVFSDLHVVGVRIDPCFPGDGSACRNQIRFVLQRVEEDGDLVRVEDAAIHVFYEVARASFEVLAQALLEQKRAPGAVSTGGALRVHPALEAATLDSSYAASLERLLVGTAVQGTLTRVTFIARDGGGGKANAWTFGGFDVDAKGALQAMDIPTARAVDGEPPPDSSPSEVLTINGVVKSVVIDSGNASLDPGPTADDGRALARIFRPAGLSKEVLNAAYGAAVGLEDPTRHTAENTDCVSCHLATPSRAWLDVNAAGGLAQPPPEGFRLPGFDLENSAKTTMSQTNAMRAFSYLESATGNPEPEISQRTINESASVADYINQKILAKAE
jgi:hypothetical protein